MKRALSSVVVALAAVLAAPAAFADPAAGTAAIAPATAPAAPPPPIVPAPSPTRATVALVCAGIAVAAAGTAGVFGGLALQNKSDFQTSATYAHAQDGNNDAAYADGAIALAVAAGITSLVLFLTHDAPSSAPAALSATPIVTARGGGAGAVLRF